MARRAGVRARRRAGDPRGLERQHNTERLVARSGAGKTLITRVDAASDPARMGTDQVRDVRFEGNRMVLRPPPREFGDVTHHRELYWEKISPV